MTLAVWRIGSNKGLTLGDLPFGSTLTPGRWHLCAPTGRPVVYAGSSRALCQLEKRVHCNGIQPLNQALMRLTLPDDAQLQAVETLAPGGLPANWRDDQAWTQAAGVDWRVRGATLGLWVPSAVEPQERNLVLNPEHPQYRQIAIDVERNPFEFDPRMF